MHCFLFIPDFFSSRSGAPADRLAAAETLIARGRRKRTAPVAHDAWLFERFGIGRQRDWPVAPYTLLADGGAPGGHFWMRADPVHLSVGRDTLALDDARLDLSRAEAEALVATLNGHFGQALALHAPHPERWYVRFEEAPQLETTPPALASGAAIGNLLPRGPDATRHRALLNEAQMLLHEHPVNAEREARGAPAANSIWLWGGGGLEAQCGRPFSFVLAEDPLARGLALAAGVPERRLSANAAVALSALPEEGKALLVLDAPRGAALERDWFSPLLAALEEGRIGMLTLVLSGGESLLEVETARSDLRHFWRTKKPLESYLA
ncbi:MAG TPA: regulator [Burkholderiales bacterium]|nr:regulator [Burkholderiales bacterium]HYA47696.1 regulator [Burkholderiales bacterium]